MTPLELLELLFEFSSLGIVASVYSRLSSVTLNLQWNGRLIFIRTFRTKKLHQWSLTSVSRRQLYHQRLSIMLHTLTLFNLLTAKTKCGLVSHQYTLLTRVNLKFKGFSNVIELVIMSQYQHLTAILRRDFLMAIIKQKRTDRANKHVPMPLRSYSNIAA